MGTGARGTRASQLSADDYSCNTPSVVVVTLVVIIVVFTRLAGERIENVLQVTNVIAIHVDPTGRRRQRGKSGDNIAERSDPVVFVGRC